jgi:O-antigen/teichoic acid export membrane protein
VCMSTGATIIVRLFYGTQFASAAPLLSILIWSEVPVFFATVVLNAMVARNLQRMLPWPTAVGAALNIVLNLTLIPKYSATGAAWATLISYTAAWMVFLLLFRSTRSLITQGLRYAIPTVFGALASVWAVTKITMPIPAKSIFAVSIFAFVMFATQMVRAGDISEARALLARALRSVT